MFFILLIFSFQIYSSTPAAVLVARKQNAYLTLVLQAKEGNVISSQSCQAYRSLFADKRSKHLQNVDVKNKLVTLGLCVLKDGQLMLKEFKINDRLFKLAKKK